MLKVQIYIKKTEENQKDNPLGLDGGGCRLSTGGVFTPKGVKKYH